MNKNYLPIKRQSRKRAIFSKERRQYYRLEIDDLKTLIRKEGGTDFSSARIANISVAGVYLKPEKPLISGRLIELSFQLPGAVKKPITCQAKIVWTAKFNGYHGGLEFVDIKRIDRYRIAGFIKDSLRKMRLEKLQSRD